MMDSLYLFGDSLSPNHPFICRCLLQWKPSTLSSFVTNIRTFPCLVFILRVASSYCRNISMCIVNADDVYVVRCAVWELKLFAMMHSLSVILVFVSPEARHLLEIESLFNRCFWYLRFLDIKISFLISRLCKLTNSEPFSNSIMSTMYYFIDHNASKHQHNALPPSASGWSCLLDCQRDIIFLAGKLAGQVHPVQGSVQVLGLRWMCCEDLNKSI